MDTAIHILWKWAIINAIAQPLMLCFLVPMTRSGLQMPGAHLMWTRPWETLADHPLLQTNEKGVRYLGGTAYPLPWKFAWQQCFFFPVVTMGITLFNCVHGAGFSFAFSMAVMMTALLALLGVMLWYFRRTQPRWLNKFLATLPPDARPMNVGETPVAA